MKKLLSLLLTSALLLTMAGCSDNTSVSSDVSKDSSTADESVASDSTPESSADTDTSAESTSAIESTPESEVDFSTLSEEEIYDLMVERSLMTTGDMTRMANVLKRAQNGETINVSYIGGSITEGYMGGTEDIFATAATNWLGEQFPSATFNCINAGISGTPSILGNIRLERDILDHDPDICFVEFAVNDGNAIQYKESYESLVRTLLEQDKDIAVVLIFTVIKSGHTCQPHMSQIGEHYGLPMISLPDSIGVEFADGRMTWEEYSDDESHPNPYGHKIITDFIANYYENVIPTIDDNAGEVSKTLPEPIFSGRFAHTHYIDSEDLEPTLVGFVENDTHSSFHNGWMYKGKEEASFSFTINCKSLQMIYKANKSKAFADADIYIDGELKMTVSSNLSDGWNNPVTAILIDSDEVAEHTVEIRLNGGTIQYFGILGFGYCD